MGPAAGSDAAREILDEYASCHLRLGKRTGAAILTGLLLWLRHQPAPIGRGRRRSPRPSLQRYDDRHAAVATTSTAIGARRAAGPPPARYYAPTRYAGWGGGWYGPRPAAHARYSCEPCGHWYGRRSSLSRARAPSPPHRLAQSIPLVIGAAAFGWIFYGQLNRSELRRGEAGWRDAVPPLGRLGLGASALASTTRRSPGCAAPWPSRPSGA